MRVFISIPLSEKVKDAAVKAIEDMKRSGARGSWVLREKMHLTLAFIGETEEIRAIEEALDHVTFDPFCIETEGFGHFGNLYWMGLKESPGLKKLTASVRKSLNDFGIPFDRKPFKAHITLARRVRTEKTIRVQVPPVKMEVTTFSLMRSDRVKGKMKYTELTAWDAEEEKISSAEDWSSSGRRETGDRILLESPRLMIRQISEADKEDYLYGASLASDYKAAYQDEELSMQLWQDVLGDQDSVTMIIYERSSGKVAGTCSFDHWTGDYPEIGINIDPAMQKRGFGTETICSMTEYFKETRPGKELFIRTKLDNLACQKMIRKCGGRKVSSRGTGGRDDLLTYSLYSSDRSVKNS